MDHKDLLDSVVKNMASATDNIPQQPSQEDIDKSIHLELSTGDTFLVDTANFDWVKAIENLDQMTENENAFINMMSSCIRPSDDEGYKEWLNAMIVNLTEYLKGYEIEVDYKTINPNITDREIVMLMAFDANNITRTMKYHVMKFMYDTGYDRAAFVVAKDDKEDPLKEWINGLSTTPEEDPNTLWKCILFCDDLGNIESASINKVDDFVPDEFMVVCNEKEDNNISVVVSAPSERKAWETAEELFSDTIESSDIITEELLDRDMFDDEDETYDDFDPTIFGLTNAEVAQKNNEFLSNMQSFIMEVLSPDEIEYIMESEVNPHDEKLKAIEKKLDAAGYSDKLKDISQVIFNNKEAAE